MSLRLSILDLAPVGPGQTPRESFRASVELARAAERLRLPAGLVRRAPQHGRDRVVGHERAHRHVAAHTSTIRLGAGGVMLPNHSPLTIAEQFGTLETLHPGRIDLGLGRAPGQRRATAGAAPRRHSADGFPQDVLELQGYLQGRSHIPGVEAVPGANAVLGWPVCSFPRCACVPTCCPQWLAVMSRMSH